MKLGLSMTGAALLTKNLQALSVASRRRTLLNVLRDAAEPIAGRAAELAPIDPETHRHLKDWIVITPVSAAESGAEAAVVVGPAKATFWGLFLEFGTIKMRPEPFMRPAFDYGTDRAVGILRDGLWELLDASIASSSARGSSTGGGML